MLEGCYFSSVHRTVTGTDVIKGHFSYPHGNAPLPDFSTVKPVFKKCCFGAPTTPVSCGREGKTVKNFSGLAKICCRVDGQL